MPKIELVYFNGCPNIEVARSAIRSAGIKEFLEINLDNVELEHAYQGYSSPSVLFNGQVIAGSQNNSSACSIVDWSSVSSAIRNLVANIDSSYQT